MIIGDQKRQKTLMIDDRFMPVIFELINKNKNAAIVYLYLVNSMHKNLLISTNEEIANNTDLYQEEVQSAIKILSQEDLIQTEQVVKFTAYKINQNFIYNI